MSVTDGHILMILAYLGVCAVGIVALFPSAIREPARGERIATAVSWMLATALLVICWQVIE